MMVTYYVDDSPDVAQISFAPRSELFWVAPGALSPRLAKSSAACPSQASCAVVLTADHAGVNLKDELAGWLSEQGHEEFLDLGNSGP